MIVTVNSQLLAAELRLLNRVVPSKPAIAILGYALLRADGESLNFYATDLEVGLTTNCPAHADVPGSAVVPVGLLLSMVERFVDGDVTIALDENKLLVKCGAFQSRLQVLPREEFPPPKLAEGKSITLDGDAFRALIPRVRSAILSSGPRVILQGALLTLAGPVAALAATDTHRVALATMGKEPDENTLRVVIPTKTLDALVGLEGRSMDDGDVCLTIGERHLFFEVAGRTLTSRTIDGQFPAYERAIPRENDKVVTIDRLELLMAIQRVVLASQETNAVHFIIEPGKMELAASSLEVGHANETLSVGYNGPPIRVCMKGKYALDFLEAARGLTVTMALKDPKTPALFQDGVDFITVVMLMRDGK